MPHLQITAPKPRPGESYEHFTVRAHYALMKQVQDPDDRNDIVEACWQDAHGPSTAEKIAQRTFAKDRFRPHPGVCYFMEHETSGPDGSPRSFGAREMINIYKNANSRIASTNAHPAITIGHTPNEGEDKPEPEVAGYVGNYRLGMVDRENPKFAIFADEYHDHEMAPKLNKRRRRSVELWTFKDGRQHFDPVAALGAEAPRLALPVKFRRAESPEGTVEKYSYSAAVAPGAANTFVQQFKKKDKGKYEMSTLSNEDRAQIAADIFQTPEMQDVMSFIQMMKTKMGTDDPGLGDYGMGDGYAGEEGAEPEPTGQAPGAAGAMPPSNPEVPEAPEAEEFEADLGDEDGIPVGDEDLDVDPEQTEGGEANGAPPEMPADDTPPPPADPEAGPPTAEDAGEDDLDALLAALEGGSPEEDEEISKMSQQNGDVTVDKYNALAAEHRRLKYSQNQALAKIGRLSGAVRTLQRREADAQRKVTIHELHQRYGDLVDVDEELQANLYSAGANVTEKEFKKHVSTIEKYGARVSGNMAMVPGGLAFGGDESAELSKYEQQITDRAVEIATLAANKGQTLTYVEAREKAAEEIRPRS